MFENIVEQQAVLQLASDLKGAMAPSMLFTGPPYSGKASTALELARILSCEKEAEMHCSCHACKQHRILAHPDLLVLGPRPFSQEIAAAASAFKRNPDTKRLLFVQTLNKLLVRFSAQVWEGDPKFAKLSNTIAGLQEEVDELLLDKRTTESVIKKKCASLQEAASKLEEEGISGTIPVGHIRSCAYWSHSAPIGKKKVLLIEQADCMQEGARNSLLKLLEEPPKILTVVLTTSREKMLLPTILSRLRPYRFVKRTPECEKGIIQSIFEDEDETHSSLADYFESFSTVSRGLIYEAAAFFVAGVSINIAHKLRKRNTAIPQDIVSLGKYTVDYVEKSGLGRPPDNDMPSLFKIISEKNILGAAFAAFLQNVLDIVMECYRQNASATAPSNLDVWRRHINEAAVAVGTYNQSPLASAEQLFVKLVQNLVI